MFSISLNMIKFCNTFFAFGVHEDNVGSAGILLKLGNCPLSPAAPPVAPLYGFLSGSSLYA